MKKVTEIIDVECTFSPFEMMHLSKKILPAPEPIPIGIHMKITKDGINNNVYEDSELYPSKWYSYYTGGGEEWTLFGDPSLQLGEYS